MVTDTVLAGYATGNVRYFRPDDPLVAAEFDSFVALLPALRDAHGGEYVAVRGGQVIATGVYLDRVLKAAKAALGEEAFYCGWVEPPEGTVIRFPSVVWTSEMPPP